MSFLTKIELSTAIVFATVTQVNRGGSSVKLCVTKSYKGNLNGEVKIEVPLSWLPTKWFKRKESALIFLSEQNGKLFAFGLKSRMPIVERNGEAVERNGEAYLISYNCDADFWGGIETKQLANENWDVVSEVSFEAVEELLVKGAENSKGQTTCENSKGQTTCKK